MKSMKQRIAKAFGGGTSKERGTSNLEIVVWMSVVLVIAVGMFLLRDNIAKFINNAATQIAGEESNDGLNEYGFYFDKEYYSEGFDMTIIFHEDGSYDSYMGGQYMGNTGGLSYSSGFIDDSYNGFVVSTDGKTLDIPSGTSFVLKE